MFSRRDLQELARYQSTSGPILSVYLDVDPTRYNRDEYRLALRGLLREAEAMNATPEDIEAIEHFIDLEYDWSGRGIAMFSCAADDFWQMHSLAVPLKNYVFVWNKPYVTPLAQLWNTYGRCVVGIVDRQGAKLMLFQMGELVKTEGIMGEEVRRLKAGRGSAAGRRGGAMDSAKAEDEVVARNLKEAAEVTVAFCEAHRPRNLLLGGERETLNQFQSRLPRVWADRVLSTFPADMTMGENDVHEKALAILDKVEEERKAALADAVITAAAKGKGGMISLDETLGATHDGRVQTLVVAEGYHAEGFQCQGCAYVTAQRLEACPFCGGKMEHIPDAVETIIGRVLEQNGRVEIVSGHERLDKAGIGALLRY